MTEIMLWEMNKDQCPKTHDTVIYQWLCGDCDYYRGFQLYNGLLCVKCSYYADIAKQAKDDES